MIWEGHGEILKVAELPFPVVITPEIKSYQWRIDTKYYHTEIHLCTTESRTIGDKSFADSVEAFIHYFDPLVPSSFDLANAWLPYLSHIEPQVQILVCKSIKDSDAVGRKNTLAWCIENGFELVELEPEPDSDEEDDDFPETKGLSRIVQALHAHTWPNLELKDSPPIQSPLVRQMMKEQHIINKEREKHTKSNQNSSSQSDPCGIVSTESCFDKMPMNTIQSSDAAACIHSTTISDIQPDSNIAVASDRTDMKIDGVSKDFDANFGALPKDDIDWSTFFGTVTPENNNDDAPLDDKDLGVDDFEQLFMKLKVMKDRAENMPSNERKRYAEKVAISFWNAIGGDEDEIGDLDADSD
ncbi:alpha- and gamma-adaptin-binding protein p34-like [Plakobranchus ocellatus]|uniref:Alpha- and gamma-adaptin-binding protein p34-like n=1 Tax=Plakobranchus ocellatus TaxID=259542 RepID=A0AAV4BZZ7_9GAST|nr:alpha- and gamma-adaptin-binding protein p34-like [Plakobranchus ocellatus]